MALHRDRDGLVDLIELCGGGHTDSRTQAWYQLVLDIADLRASPDYRWADAQLAGIAETVERTQHVTPGQLAAVARIAGSEWAPGRAYDRWGHGRRWR